ncbi:MAG TPA: hypothetical protein VHC69_09065 [Polyangiaceae bacterium]|nr:hypothetical protein [Polyangiaceae bacterium]
MTRSTPSKTIAITSLLVAACGPSITTSSEQRFNITFRAVTDDGDALASVAFLTGDKLLGLTDANGTLGVALKSSEGQTLPVGVKCPGGFASPDAVPALRLARSRLVAEQRGTSPPISFLATCTRESRDVVVLVHTDHGDALPVLVDGKPIATTDANGVAHVLVDFGRDVRSFEVRLDTTERRDLKPANPSRTFELTGRDAIVLFEQPMTVAPKLVVRKVQPARHIPYRID